MFKDCAGISMKIFNKHMYFNFINCKQGVSKCSLNN